MTWEVRPLAQRAGLAWILPDVAMVAACVTLFYCLFLYQGYRRFFRDSDAGWHIRNGEEILRSGRVPHTDPYSFTRAGQPWYSWEWAADVATGAVHRAWGLGGIAIFYAAAIAAGVWLWFRLHWALGGNFFITCAMAPLLLSTENIHWLARPHVLSWIFFLIALWYCERRRGRFTPREAAGVFAFCALWANVHPSFVFAPVMALCYALDPVTGRKCKALFWAAGVAMVAPLVNPYGYLLYEHVLRYLTDRALLARIGEYQSFNFQAEGAWQIIAAVMLGMAGGTLAAVRKQYGRLLLSVLLTALALRSARVLPIDALLLLPLANAEISRLFHHDYAERLRALDARQNGLVLAPLMLLACFFLLQAPGLRAATGFAPEDFPVGAYTHIPAHARLFAPDKFGGYLIYRSAGNFPVFFDGRSDLYGAEFLQQYGRMLQLRPGWQTWFNSFHFTHALLPADSPLTGALEQLGWKEIFHDRTATLLAGGGT